MPGTEVRETRSTLMWPDGAMSTPTASRPRSEVFGIEPTVIRAWEPMTSRPSEVTTRTPPSSVRSTRSQRAFFTTSTPRSSSTSSRASAASASSCGRIRSREATMVTFTPSSVNAETNSAPVTPEPTTTRCSGISSRS